MILRGPQLGAIGVMAVAVLAVLWPRPVELAALQARAGDRQAAIAALEREHALQPADDTLAATLGGLYEQTGDLVAALALLEASGQRRLLTSEEVARGRRLALATGSAARALAIATGPHQPPPDAIALPGLVELALQAGNPRQAVAWQQQLVAMHPTDPAHLARLRDLELAQQALPAAITAQQRVVALGGERRERERLAGLFLQAGQGLQAYETLAGLPPPGDGAQAAAWYDRLADLATWAKRPKQAFTHQLAAFDAAPTPARGLHLLGTLGTVAARERPARWRAQQAVRVQRRFPADLPIRTAARQVRVAAGDLVGVRQDLLAAVKARPDDATAHEELVAFAEWRDRPTAMAELARWGTRQGQRPAGFAARAKLATLYGWEQRPAEAQAAWTSLLADAEGRVPAATERPWRESLLAISGLPEDLTPSGAHNLVRLNQLHPGQPALMRRLANAHHELGESPEALRVLGDLLKHAGATTADAQRLAVWLAWYGQERAALLLLGDLADRQALDVVALRDAGTLAARIEDWSAAMRFFGQAARRAPQDAETWQTLAVVAERLGDGNQAIAAWKRRLALPGANETMQQIAVGLLVREGRPLEALALTRDVSKGTTPQTLRTRADLAARVGDAAERERALRDLVARVPDDANAWGALGELLDSRNQPEQATLAFERAIAHAPHDARLLTQVVARQLYGGRRDQAATLIERLAAVPPASGDTLRVLADYFEPVDPARSIDALNQLHARGEGDATTWLRLGDLEQAAGNPEAAATAWRQAVPGASPDSPGASNLLGRRMAQANALDRLGRKPEADAAWLALAAQMPEAPAPARELARRALAAHDPTRARPYLERVQRLDATSFDTRLLTAEALAAENQHQQAADAFQALAVERPDLAFLPAQEAVSRQALGQYGRAREALREAIARVPASPGLADAYRYYRDDGSSRVETAWAQEQSSLISYQGPRTEVAWRLGDRWRLVADLGNRWWNDQVVGSWRTEEVGLAVQFQQPGLTGWLHAAVQRQDGVVSPLFAARLLGQGTPGGWPLGLELGLSHGRWAESAPALRAHGRETRAELALTCRPEPRVGLRATGEFGLLALAGRGVGQALGGGLELTLQPAPLSPWRASWGLRGRHWGLAGPLVGLPVQVAYQTLLVGYQTRWGPLALDVAPGWTFDLQNGANAPAGSLQLAWTLTPDLTISAQAEASGRAFGVGANGLYQRLDLRMGYYF